MEVKKRDMSVTLSGVRLDNPVIPASGCYGFGYVMQDYFDQNILGAISLKGTTLNPRKGNPVPRVAECTSGMINSVGLQNPGIDVVISKEIPELRKVYHKPIVANISGFSVDEYVQCCAKADGCSDIDIVELNVSCPNVHGGGMSFGTTPQGAAEVTHAVRKTTKLPLIVKLTPNVTSIADIAVAVEEAGADALCVANTFLGMRIDTRTRRTITSRPTAGFSGPAVFPMALRCVWQTANAVNIPIVGCGGVNSANDVIEMMMAGACAVEVGTANLISPTAAADIAAALPEEMNRLGISSLSEIIGACVGL